MAIIKKFSSYQNLTNVQTAYVDTNPNSDYFRITEFNETFTGGKNGFLIEGSPLLKESTEVKIEILDVEGNPIYYEPGDGIPEYYEGISKLISVHIYDDTPIGLGKITILGEAKQFIDINGNTQNVPESERGFYNVKWERTFQINKNLNNESIVRFYKRPQIQITELVKPIFSKTIPQVTDTVEVTGEPQIPSFDTDLSTWRAGTTYKLIRATGSWDRDVDENTITIDVNGTTFSSNIIEVLNDREVLVDIPYTENNLVKSFVSQSSSVTYSDFQNEIVGESTLTGSFAKIDMSQLKTFVGDVARVKVFRKSRQSAGDFQFVQESKLESTELLRDITTQQNTELSYGRFDETNFDTYWETSSVSHPTSINSSVLSQAVKVDYDSNVGGVQRLITKNSFSIAQDVEYTLSFRTLLSGSIDSEKYIDVYFSGSYTNSFGNPATYTQSFMKINGDDIYTTRQNVSQNILGERDIDAKLVFEFKGDDWYISNVSLRNAQETSFSPDEFTLIQDIPRKLASETFDFRFEFYDINNNYIPVDVLASATFNGGNDFPTSGKLLTFESDRNAFRFESGSVANPFNQTIQFKVTTQNLTGSILFTSQAFDIDGNLLDPNDYTQYPGNLTNITPAGALLTLSNFTGSRVDGLQTPYVGSIVYTASLENLEEFETVYRLEDGDNAPQLIVTSNANQFIYEPTTLSPKPSGQSITVRAQRKNLASLITPLTINKSDSNGPDLNFVSTQNGIDTYTISALQFSSSFSQNNFDEITYSFTGSDVFGNEQSDEITLSKVINFDGVSVVLSNEATSFRSDSTGTVTSDEFDEGDGTVDVRIGSNVISHSEGLGTKNTFDIISVTPSTGLTANDETPTTNSYGISAMSVDKGNLTLLIRYKAGDNSTTVDFSKKVSYTKSKIAAPVLSIETTNKDQTVSALSTGEQIDSFSNSVVTVKEQYEGSSSTRTITSLTATSSDISSIVTNPTTGTITLNGRTLANGTNSTTISVTATVVDSEGTTRTITDTISLSKVKNSAPVIISSVNPQTQTVDSDSSFSSVGTPQNVTLIVNEGGSNYTYGTSGDNTFQITNVTGGSHIGNGVVTPTTPTDETGTSGTITFSYINSEGTSFTNKTINFSVGVAVQGADGADGADGSNGVVISLTPSSQNVKVSTSGTYDTPTIFTVTVTENGNLLTHTTNSTLSNNQFKFGTITNGSLTAGSGTTTPDITPTTPSSVVGLTTSFTVTYKDSQGNESTAIPQSHKVGVVLDGVTGPGVVHTGVWESGRIYQFDGGLLTGTGRRDTVLWSSTGSPPYDTYYATNSTHTSTNNSSSTTGRPDLGGPWTSLGTQDFFVAAKIGVFEESFIQNTLNIGSNNSGGFSSANITLYGGSTNPYFSLGQSTAGVYNANGIFIGNDGGNYRMSLKGSGGSLLWDGNNLTVNGGGNFTGNLSAPTGNIGGFTIGGSQLYTGSKSTFASTAAGVYVGTDGIALGTNSPFKVTSGGVLTATSATITGDITATNITATTAGNIGGWTISSSQLTGGSGGTTIGLIPGTGIHMGNSSFGSSPFRVTNTGLLNATDAVISGSINATDGQIGGWVIDGGILASVNGDMSLDANTSTISAATGSMVIRPGELTVTSGASVSLGIPAFIYPSTTYSSTLNTGNFRSITIATDSFSVSSTGQYIGTIPPNVYDVSEFLPNGPGLGPLSVSVRADIKFSGLLVRTIDLATSTWGLQDGDLRTNQDILSFEFNQTGTYTVEVYLYVSNSMIGVDTTDSVPLAETAETISLDKIVQFTEITNNGIQVVQSDSKFVKMTTDDSANEVLEANGVVKLTPQLSLPFGTLGSLVVQGNDLYFHNGTTWIQIS